MNDTGDLDQKGWRGSRELWLDAAKAAFLDSGIDAVKVQPLASGLGLATLAARDWFPAGSSAAPLAEVNCFPVAM